MFGFRLLRCVCFQGSIHIAAYLLQLGNFLPLGFQLRILCFVLGGQRGKLGLPCFRCQLHVRQICPQIAVRCIPYCKIGAVCFRKLFLLALPADLLVFIVDGLCLPQILCLFYELLELTDARLSASCRCGFRLPCHGQRTGRHPVLPAYRYLFLKED